MHVLLTMICCAMPDPIALEMAQRARREATPPAVVRAAGIGKPPRRLTGVRARLMARRAAEVVAVRNLARKLGRGQRTTMRGFRYVLTEYRQDGTVKVVVEYPIRGRRNHTPHRTIKSSARSGK